MCVYSKKVQNEIRKLDKQIRGLEWKQTCLRDKINELKCSESPIKAGDTIYWKSGTKQRKGNVLSVTPHYDGSYHYRCSIVSKDGRRIGFANVTGGNEPSLEKE